LLFLLKNGKIDKGDFASGQDNNAFKWQVFPFGCYVLISGRLSGF